MSDLGDMMARAIAIEWAAIVAVAFGAGVAVAVVARWLWRRFNPCPCVKGDASIHRPEDPIWDDTSTDYGPGK